ncbi:hypothetical protein J7438_15595 [Thalassotalea sp. G20_0]|uniref:hypothetical protein n=1 Tax=Thalassotalea sp. G20_0 TaxID=2821093 RepID=UPI001AD9FBA0|nr:hypothetical protein [Thalassotalea sp. G20_0]MBO9495502.1 hypothetical protein [Thalassotalea sp. G20_0]
MIPSSVNDLSYRSWYFDKSNPIHKGDIGKLSKRSFRVMKRVSPYPLKLTYIPISDKVRRPLTLSLEVGKSSATQALVKVLSADQVDWGRALKLLRRGGDPFAYRGSAFRPNVLFKVIVDITNTPKIEAKKNLNSKEREGFIALLLKREGIESTLLELDATPFVNTPFTAAIAARDKSLSRAIFNYLKETHHELLITPNQKKMSGQFGKNTPLVLAIKTNNEDLALDLLPFYTNELLRQRITWANSNALELAHLARFNRLLPIMVATAQGLTMDEATHFQSLYDGCPRGNNIWHDLYESDMFLNDEGHFIEDRERVSNPVLYHTSQYIRKSVLLDW